MFAFLVILITCQNAFSNASGYNVLYLNSYNLGYAWSDSIGRGIEKALDVKNVKLFIECLDAKRFGQEKFDLFASYLSEKYSNTPVNAIITSDNDALDFIIQYGDKLFPEIPVVFCGINDPDDYNFENSRIYGFTESTDPLKTVSLLTKLVPTAKSLLFITDNTTTGTIVKPAYNNIQKLNPYIKINFIAEVDVDEILKLVKKGDQGDMVYLLRINRDKYGNMLNYLDFFQKIASESPKPVFADDEAIMSHGVVGGNANRGFTQGYRSGQLVLQFLKDSMRKNIPHVNTVQDEYIFDYKQLKKFEIDTRNLPENSVIINKPMVEYLRYIVGLTIIVVILSGIIVVLTVINRKRLLAERKVQEQITEINESKKQLEDSYEQLSNINCELEEANAQLLSLNYSLEEAKRKAEESEKLKSSFLANLSHEIRTPLNAILGFSSLLIDSDLKPSSKESYFNIIQSNSESLLILIDDILDFSRIEAGQIKINIEEVVVNDIIHELYTCFKPRITDSVNFKLNDSVFTTQVKLLTDKIRFRQILSNLLTNAFKFTEKGEIELGFKVISSAEIHFFVQDTGIGIDKKNHSAVFDRFRKIEDSKTRFYSGSGLGLAICKKMTELLGGTIWVEGDLGKGSVFSFTHPNFTIIENEEAIKAGHKANSKYNWEGCLIAVAEDEDNNYYLIDRIITEQGAKIIRFNDGRSIVDYFANNDVSKINLVLMDIKMPTMDGYEALDEIKKLHPNMIVIAQTAYAMSDNVAKLKEKRFDNYITKPINADLLKAMVNKYLFP